MKIYCVQTDIIWENKPANCARARLLLDEARPEPGSLVILPEMFACGFSMDVPRIAEDATRPTEKFLAQTAQELGITLLAGVVNSSPSGRGWNQAVIFSPQGRELARYTKMQPFNLGGEGEHYEAGKKIVMFDWNGWVVAPFICYDLRFPELFRQAAQQGAELFPVIASWPVRRIQHWTALLQARAIENQACVAGVNRVGNDPRFVYNGQSIIVHPHGEILAQAGEREETISAVVDLPALRQWRADFPALKDIRPPDRP